MFHKTNVGDSSSPHFHWATYIAICVTDFASFLKSDYKPFTLFFAQTQTLWHAEFWFTELFFRMVEVHSCLNIAVFLKKCSMKKRSLLRAMGKICILLPNPNYLWLLSPSHGILSVVGWLGQFFLARHDVRSIF